MLPTFDPTPGAGGYQHSNPPVFSSLPLIATLDIIDKAGGIEVLRTKSVRLTGYFWSLLVKSQWYRGLGSEHAEDVQGKGFRILTPPEAEHRGAQLSLLILPVGSGHMEKLFDKMVKAGVIGDERRPDVLRLSAVPLYNRFIDVQRAAEVLEQAFNEI